MTSIAILSDDVIEVVLTGSVLNDGIAIPDALAGVPVSRLRFNGEALVDASVLHQFAIDPFGIKHLPEMADPAWPVIECAFDDRLVEDVGTWRVEDAVDRLAAIKAKARTAIIARANTFTSPILSKYPEAERAGWDKREAEARAIIAAGDKAAAIAQTSVIKALAAAAGENTAATVARADAIVAKADEFASISAAVEIMRDIALTAIDAVEDAVDMPATLEALKAQATALAAQYGLA